MKTRPLVLTGFWALDSFQHEKGSTWTRPWTFAVPLTITDSEQVMPYECHEGNYAMTNILSGARAEETAGAQPTIPGEAER